MKSSFAMDLFFHDIVAAFALRNRFVLDGLDGTAADASHAVGAISLPQRFSIDYVDVVQRAPLGTFTAGNTGLGYREAFVFDEKAIIKYMNGAAEQPATDRHRLLGK